MHFMDYFMVILLGGGIFFFLFIAPIIEVAAEAKREDPEGWTQFWQDFRNIFVHPIKTFRFLNEQDK